MPAGEELLLRGPVGADRQDAFAGVAGEAGGDVPDPIAERVRVGVPQPGSSQWPRGRVQGEVGGRDAGAVPGDGKAGGHHQQTADTDGPWQPGPEARRLTFPPGQAACSGCRAELRGSGGDRWT